MSTGGILRLPDVRNASFSAARAALRRLGELDVKARCKSPRVGDASTAGSSAIFTHDMDSHAALPAML